MRGRSAAIALLILGSLIACGSAARAADENKFDVEITPVFFANATGDSFLGPPPGSIASYCPGYGGVPVPPACPGTLRGTSDLRLDYLVRYKLNPRFDLSYSHSNLDYSIGRVTTITPLSVLTGDISDHTDKVALTYHGPHSLQADFHYSSLQRSGIAATASPLFVAATGSNCYFNSERCPGGGPNPASINSTNIGVGASYDFGPHTQFEPPFFKAAFDANYYPRPHSENLKTCLAGGGPGSNAPSCGSNGVDGYVGPQLTEPYSLTMFPASLTHLTPGLIPFVSYRRESVLFRAENTPEAFNGIAYGIVKVLGDGFVLNWTSLHLKGCRCSDTVPPPDTIRFDVNIFRVTYDFKF